MSALARETPAELKRRARKILRRLAKLYPEPECELDFDSVFELLVSTILSAQCTDVRVNATTPALFERYPTPAHLATADPAELEAIVHPTGFFRRKAASIRESARIIAEEHDGEVPRTMAELLALPGIARKSANVILGTGYGIASGVVVDTHVTRLSRRMGLTREKDPVKIERALIALYPKTQWINLSHRLVLHGRRVCPARKPKCALCPADDCCPQIGVSE